MKRSALATIISVLFGFLLIAALNPDALIISTSGFVEYDQDHKILIISYVLIWAVLNIFADYISLWETRQIVIRLKGGSITRKTFLIILDFVFTYVIVSLLTFIIIIIAANLRILVIGHNFSDTPLFDPVYTLNAVYVTFIADQSAGDQTIFFSPFVWSTFFTSIWIWLALFSQLIRPATGKLANMIGGFRKIFVNPVKPYTSFGIGLCVATMLTILIIGGVSQLVLALPRQT